MTLEEARVMQTSAYDHIMYAVHGTALSQLEADYALLDATQAAIDAQTVECPRCEGDGEFYYEIPNSMSYGREGCTKCNGRGRVSK